MNIQRALLSADERVQQTLRELAKMEQVVRLGNGRLRRLRKLPRIPKECLQTFERCLQEMKHASYQSACSVLEITVGRKK